MVTLLSSSRLLTEVSVLLCKWPEARGRGFGDSSILLLLSLQPPMLDASSFPEGRDGTILSSRCARDAVTLAHFCDEDDAQRPTQSEEELRATMAGSPVTSPVIGLTTERGR